jgi:hypothetical protein
MRSGLGIGGCGSDDYNIHTEADSALPADDGYAVGTRVAPAGTTDGIRGHASDRCARCGAPADWNPGAGELLCARHWDEY